MGNMLPDIERGTTYPISGTYQDANGDTDITGATVFFTIKEEEYDDSADDSTAIVKKTVNTFTNPTAGEYEIEITPQDTELKEPGSYYYDLKIKLANGKIYPLDEGQVTLSGNATNRQT